MGYLGSIDLPSFANPKEETRSSCLKRVTGPVQTGEGLNNFTTSAVLSAKPKTVRMTTSIS